MRALKALRSQSIQVISNFNASPSILVNIFPFIIRHL